MRSDNPTTGAAVGRVRRIINLIMSDKNRKWTLYFLALLCTAWPLALMYVWSFRAEAIDPLRLFVIMVGNPMLLLSLYFLVAPRWRWTVLIPVWVATIYVMANVWYCTFFADLLPFSGIVAFNNYDSLLFESVLQAFKPWHPVFAVGAVVFTVAWAVWFRKWNRTDRFSRRVKVWGTVVSLLPCILWEGVEMVKHKLSTSDSWADTAAWRYLQKPGLSSHEEYYGGGMAQFFGRNITFAIYNNYHVRTLTPEQRSMVAAYLAAHDTKVGSHPALTAKLAENKDKNLIFIVVESLNADAVTATVNGREVMPNLRRLLTDSAAVASLAMVSQIGSGMSSDGQFTYNTGLFPANDATTVLAYPANTYPGLPVALGRHGVEVIAENPTFWNHDRTNRAFGYKALISNTNHRARTEHLFRDDALFNTILEVTDTLPQPFMLFTATIGMHTPYADENLAMAPWLETADLTAERRNYYNVCNAFDTSLARFIAELRRRGIYDRSVIVLASDHAGALDGHRQDQPIVFGALNTGLTSAMLAEAGIGPRIAMTQVDVYPTVLDLMGALPAAPFKGMGYSILNNPSIATPSDSTARTAANLMQYGNWFAPASSRK